MSRSPRVLLMVCLASLLPRISTAVLSAAEILRRADAIRMPAGDFRVKADVVSEIPGKANQKASYEVLLKGRERTLIQTLSPATERGTSLLMLAQDLWVYVPRLSKPLRISMQQRLLGEVANGDLARMNFSGDYDARLKESAPTFYLLALKAKREEVTYGSVELWVDKQTFRPLKARFFSFSGKPLKVGSYEDYREMAGAQRPGRLVFSDMLIKGKKSTIHYSELTPTDLPEKYFTKDHLKKLTY